MQIFPCQMSSFLQTIVLTPAQVLRPRAPPPLQPPDSTVHTAVEGPEMTVTDQVWYMCLETLSIHIMFFLNLTLFVFILFFFYRHPHRSCAGSTGQTQRGEDGTAHANKETLSLCPVSHRYLHTSRWAEGPDQWQFFLTNPSTEFLLGCV